MSEDRKDEGTIDLYELSHRKRNYPEQSPEGDVLHVEPEFESRNHRRTGSSTSGSRKGSGGTAYENRRRTVSENHREQESERRGTSSSEIRRKKRKRRRKRNRTGSIVGILSLVLIVLLVIILVRFFKDRASVNSDVKKLTADDFKYTVSEELQQVGTGAEKKEVADYEGYAVHYPVTGYEAIDQKIESHVDDSISVFRTMVQGCKQDTPVRMTMVTDYESYLIGNALISVKFDTTTELPLENLSGDTIETYTYRISDGEEIALGDVLSDGYLDLLSEKTKEFAQSQEGTLVESAVLPDALNFQNFYWTSSGLTLYFSEGKLMEENDTILSFEIPMEELEEYLTVDLSADNTPIVPGTDSTDSESDGEEPTSEASTTAEVTPTGTIDSSKPMVCLTFDDGPKASTTPELLDILEANDAHATFFVVGNSLQAQGAKEIVERELAIGCQVANHTMTHQNLKTISDAEIDAEIEGVNDILEGWGLNATTVLRPPYGGWNNHVRDVVQYPMIRWNVDTLDWDTRSAEKTIYAVLEDPDLMAADGDIILMHDIHPETIEACKTIIPELKARGFQLVTIEEMFAAKGIPLETGKVYYNTGHIKTDFGS